MHQSESHILSELYFFPPVPYFEALRGTRIIELESCGHYVKGSFRNRCYIATPQGPQLLSIPLVKGKNQSMPIREVRISYDQPWQRHMWRSLQCAYGRSAFFEFYRDALYPYFDKPYAWLFDYNLAIFQTLCRLLGFKAEIRLSQQYNHPSNSEITDLRRHWSPPLDPPPAAYCTYPQVFSDRQPFLYGMSILDLLFCCGSRSWYYLDQGRHFSSPVYIENG